uniref:Uncharacterized protein n=1 Tax=Daphnia galeata TaxID=27404 RepID=A0A8J2WMG4_9CRUS|nr:unnamed protein product [Daphnia galeata]
MIQEAMESAHYPNKEKYEEIWKLAVAKMTSKTSKLTSTLQHFKQVFCQAEGWRIDTFLSSCADVQQNSFPLNLLIKAHSSQNTKYTSGLIMANPSVDPFAVTSEEDGENVNIKQSRTTISKTDSFESTKLLSTPNRRTTSFLAPSPPPSRQIPQQMKRGRGGRGRGRTKKISSMRLPCECPFNSLHQSGRLQSYIQF